MNTQLLKEFGLSDKEIKVYLALLQSGRMTPAELARMTKLQRPTVYSVCAELVSKGVLVEDLGRHQKTFVARKAVDFLTLIDQEERALVKKRKLAQRIVEELQDVASNEARFTPKVMYVPAEKIEAHLYERTPLWNASMQKTKTAYWGYQDHKLVETYQEWIDWYWKQSPKNIELYLFTNAAPVEEAMRKKKYPRRHMKFWKGKSPFTATTWVMGDFVCMIVTKERNRYLIEIEDTLVAANYRAVMEALWSNELFGFLSGI
ncbi:MAG: winged helix-turn-helix transcriptional regulator [Candidatus Kerfeldbacteria bacterium]|nr:winged helix-turn-helix transcriptional regulator [Candidatus Kerfeldbacteria bacterium]